MQRYLRLILTIMAAIPAGSSAQTPPPAIEGPVYVATYVEVVPTAVDEGAALLKQYRDASRKDAGNQRMELVQELGRPSRFALLAIWADQKFRPASRMRVSNSSTGVSSKTFACSLGVPKSPLKSNRSESFLSFQSPLASVGLLPPWISKPQST